MVIPRKLTTPLGAGLRNGKTIAENEDKGKTQTKRNSGGTKQTVVASVPIQQKVVSENLKSGTKKRTRSTKLPEQPGKKISIRNFTLVKKENGFGFDFIEKRGKWFVSSVTPKSPAWNKLLVNDCIIHIDSNHGAIIEIDNTTTLDEIESLLDIDDCLSFRVERYI